MGRISGVWIICGLAVGVLSVLSWFFLQPRPVLPLPSNAEDLKRMSGEAVGNPAFAGHQRCAECHADLHQSHMTTPHSRTFVATADSAAAKSFCDSRHFAGGQYGDYQYECNEDGLAVALNGRFPGRLFPLHFAIGSGQHAVTFLTLQPAGRETVAVEHRMSWFRDGERVDITPGQLHAEPNRDMSYFGKVIRGAEMHRCVNCHVTTGKIVGAEIHNLTPGIHCERCHGPGAAHADAAEAGDMDTALSAIQSRWTGAQEVAMCGDCHRLPHDIVGDQLTEYPNALVRFQPIGLLKSRCFLHSEGALRCTTCHDAHADVRSRSVERQTESCRSCHSSPDQTPCDANETTKCIDCHMPAVQLLPGVSFHDHWIRVRNDTQLHDSTEDISGQSSRLKTGP